MPYVKIDALGYSSRMFSSSPQVNPPKPSCTDVMIWKPWSKLLLKKMINTIGLSIINTCNWSHSSMKNRKVSSKLSVSYITRQYKENLRGTSAVYRAQVYLLVLVISSTSRIISIKWLNGITHLIAIDLIKGVWMVVSAVKVRPYFDTVVQIQILFDGFLNTL
jgi:hypothetical protein